MIFSIQAKSSLAEMGTKIFAVFNIMVVTFMCLASLCAILVPFLGTIFGYDVPIILFSKFLDTLEHTFLFIFLIIMVIFLSGFALVFAAFLVNGVFKKNPDHIKAYLLFGLVVVVVSALSLLAVVIMGYTTSTVQCIVLILCVLYSLALRMINTTYKQFQGLEHQNDSLLLGGNKC